MEDAHATILNLDGKTGNEKASFFAVYDGHGGTLFLLLLFSFFLVLASAIALLSSN